MPRAAPLKLSEKAAEPMSGRRGSMGVARGLQRRCIPGQKNVGIDRLMPGRACPQPRMRLTIRREFAAIRALKAGTELMP